MRVRSAPVILGPVVFWSCTGQSKELKGLRMTDSTIRARTPDEARAVYNAQNPGYDCRIVVEFAPGATPRIKEFVEEKV